LRVLVFVLLCLIWGFSWVAIKFSLEGIPPFLGAGLRFLIAVPLLYVYPFNTVVGMILIFLGIAIAELPKYRALLVRRAE
jgi:drug/metabolite transporter (DMT)-like permease